MTRMLEGRLSLLVLLLSWSLASLAASVRPLDLDGLVESASTVFQGRCLESRGERDPATGLIVTLTTFEVQEAIKGSPGPLHTIKQLGGRVGEEVNRIDGIPSFTPGEDYIVFLYGVSAAGFSSPVGLSQGRFAIRPEAQGRVVGNGRDLREVLPPAALARMPAHAQKRLSSPAGELVHMDLEEFKALVRERSRQ